MTNVVSRGDVLEPVYLNNLRVACRGWGVISGLAVSQRGAGANMSVDVASGSAWINGVVVTVGATTNVAVTASSPTYDRYDLVVINSSGTISVIAGVAAATSYASDYDLEANNAILLALIYIPATDTAVDSTEITDKRVFTPQIVDTQISASAGIALTKLASGAAYSALSGNIAGTKVQGTVYQNGTKWRVVTLVMSATSGSPVIYIAAKVTNPPNASPGTDDISVVVPSVGGYYTGITFLVPPNWFYRVSTGGTMNYWYENDA